MLFKQVVAMFLAFIFGIQYIVIPELSYAQGANTAPTEQQSSNMENIGYYQQLDYVGTTEDLVNGYPSMFVLPDSQAYPLISIPFIIGEVYEVIPIKNGEKISIKTVKDGGQVGFEVLYNKTFTDLDVKPVKGEKYLVSYVPYQFSDGEVVTYIARAWNVEDLPPVLLNDKGEVISISGDNKDYTRHYFETKFKLDRYVLQNVCPANSKDKTKEDVLSVYEEVTKTDNFNNFVNWYNQNRADNQAQPGWINCYINYVYGLNPEYVAELFTQYAVENKLISPSLVDTGDLVKPELPDTDNNEVSDDLEEESNLDSEDNASVSDEELDESDLLPEEVVQDNAFNTAINFGRDVITAAMDEADEFEDNMFELANNFISNTLDDVSININRNNNRNWEVGSTISNISEDIAGVVNTGITTAGDVINTGITTAGGVANTAITTTPQVLNSVMPLLTASQEQLHQLERRIGEDIDYLIDTSILKIARDALAARFGAVAMGGIRNIPRALIGDVSGNAAGSIRGDDQEGLNIPDNIQMPENINQPSNLEDYDLYAMLQMDKNQNGKITIREMRQAVRENRKNLPIIQRIFNVLSRKDMREARRDRRDYNKNNPIKNNQPTIFMQGVPVNQNNMPSNNTMPGGFGANNLPGTTVGLGSNTMPSGLGGGSVMPVGIAGSTGFSSMTGVSQPGGFSATGMGMGMPPLPPLGTLPEEQREAVEEQLIEQGYEVDFDNPATLDFNRDGVIDEDEIDLAVTLDREGMNVIGRTLNRLTRSSVRQAENAAEEYNGEDEKKNGILGRIFNRDRGGDDSSSPQPQQTQLYYQSMLQQPQIAYPVNLSVTGGGFSSPSFVSTPIINPGSTPGTNLSVTSQSRQVSQEELRAYANNMLELEKLALAIEEGRSGIYARSEQEEMEILRTVENTILIYQRMIEMAVGAFQEDGYYYYQIANTGVRNSNAAGWRSNIINYNLPQIINSLNNNDNIDYNYIRDRIRTIRNNEGLILNSDGTRLLDSGSRIYGNHKWQVTKVPMDNAERQLRQLIRQVNPLLQNALIPGRESVTSSGGDMINLGTGITGVMNNIFSNLRGGVVNPETCPLPLADDMCDVMQDDVQKNPYVHQLLCEKYPDIINTRQNVQLGGSSNWLFFNKYGVNYSSTPIANNNQHDVYLLSKDNGFSVEEYNNGTFQIVFDNHQMKDKQTGRIVVTVNNSQVDGPCWCVVPVQPNCRNINLPTSSSATNGSTSYEPPTGDTGSGWLHVATPPLGWTPNGWVYPPENLSPEEEAYWYWLHDGK